MKKFLIILGSLIALIVLAVTIFLVTFDINRYRSDIVMRMSLLLGRPVQIEQMSMKLAVVPTVKVDKIKILNTTGVDSEEVFMEIDNANVTLALAPLLSKRVEIKDITLGHVKLNLVQNNGKHNWQIASHNSAVNENNRVWLANTRIESLSAKKVDISYQGKVNLNIPMMDLSIKHLKVFTSQIAYNGGMFQLSGTVNDLLDLVRQVPDYAFNLELTGAEATLKINGVIGDTVDFKKILINAVAEGKNLRTTLEKLGTNSAYYPTQSFKIDSVFQGEPSLMEIKKCQFNLDKKKLNADLTGSVVNAEAGMRLDGHINVNVNDWALAQLWGLRPMAIQTDFTMTPAEIVIADLGVQAGRSDVHVSGKIVQEQEKPYFDLSVAADYLNLQDIVLGETSYDSELDESQRVQNVLNYHLNWEWMNQLNAAVKIALPHLQITDSFMMGIYGNAMIQNGILSTEAVKMKILNGYVTAMASINSETGVVSLNLNGQSLNLNMVKKIDYMIKDSMIDVVSSLTSVGHSVGELLAHLTGTIKAELSKGRIVDPDFNNLADILFNENKHSVSYTTADRESEILCGAMNIVLQDGQIYPRTSQIALETSRVNLEMDGSVNLATDEFDVMMIPSAAKVVEHQVPNIKLSGSFFNPNMELIDVPAEEAKKGYTPYVSCQNILGHQTKAQLEEIEKSQRMLPLPKVQETDQGQENSFQKRLQQELKRRQ